jgi:hypothetical protein
MRSCSTASHGGLLAVEDARGADVQPPLVAGELDHAAVGREVAAQDRQPAAGLDRVVQRPHDALSRRLGRLASVVADGPAGHRHRVLVQQAGLEQSPGDERDAAGLVEVRRDVPAPGLEVAQQRRPRADRVEVVDRQVHADLAGDGQQVQDRVRRAAGAGDRGDRVLQALAGDDLARADPALERLDAQAPGLDGDIGLRAVLGGDHRGAHRRDPEHLEGHGHGVGGELAAARARAGAGHGLELVQLLVGHAAGRVGAHASKTSWIVTSWPSKRPGRIEPP